VGECDETMSEHGLLHLYSIRASNALPVAKLFSNHFLQTLLCRMILKWAHSFARQEVLILKVCCVLYSNWLEVV
jgi:hypothetical protein